jgi:hypothetical protein
MGDHHRHHLFPDMGRQGKHACRQNRPQRQINQEFAAPYPASFGFAVSIRSGT